MQYSFSDMVTIPHIQRMLDTFESGSGVSTEIMDMDGQIIVASSARSTWRELHPDTLQSRQSAGKILFQNRERSTPRDELLKGLFQYARAIHVEGRFFMLSQTKIHSAGWRRSLVLMKQLSWRK